MAAVVARTSAEREGRLLLETSRRSQEINAQLLHYQIMVEGIAAAAGQALAREPKGDEPVYFTEDFVAPGPASGGLLPSIVHGGPVSLAGLVSVHAPNAPREPLLPDLRRLYPLRAELKRILLRSAEVNGVAAKHHGVQPILESGGPILWAYVGLANGAAVLYPGTSRVPQGYDPRARPWYTAAAGERGARWGSPFIDAIRGERVLSCSASIFNEGERLLGVAGMSMTFAPLRRSLPIVIGGYAVDEALLLDDQGRVMARALAGEDPARSGESKDAAIPDVFDAPEVVREIRDKRSGHLEIRRASGPVVFTYDRIGVLGWYYVVVARLSNRE
jgi:hypothetical protein